MNQQGKKPGLLHKIAGKFTGTRNKSDTLTASTMSPPFNRAHTGPTLPTQSEVTPRLRPRAQTDTPKPMGPRGANYRLIQSQLLKDRPALTQKNLNDALEQQSLNNGIQNVAQHQPMRVPTPDISRKHRSHGAVIESVKDEPMPPLPKHPPRKSALKQKQPTRTRPIAKQIKFNDRVALGYSAEAYASLQDVPNLKDVGPSMVSQRVAPTPASATRASLLQLHLEIPPAPVSPVSTISSLGQDISPSQRLFSDFSEVSQAAFHERDTSGATGLYHADTDRSIPPALMAAMGRSRHGSLYALSAPPKAKPKLNHPVFIESREDLGDCTPTTTTAATANPLNTGSRDVYQHPELCFSNSYLKWQEEVLAAGNTRANNNIPSRLPSRPCPQPLPTRKPLPITTHPPRAVHDRPAPPSLSQPPIPPRRSSHQPPAASSFAYANVRARNRARTRSGGSKSSARSLGKTGLSPTDYVVGGGPAFESFAQRTEGQWRQQ